jgi:hypothetical protein
MTLPALKVGAPLGIRIVNALPLVKPPARRLLDLLGRQSQPVFGIHAACAREPFFHRWHLLVDTPNYLM